jgi:LAO/AO transport system kinase
MDRDLDSLIDKLLNGNRRALARVISLIEDSEQFLEQALTRLYPHTGRAKTIGVTGSPGAGKSTLVDNLVVNLVEQGNSVAVLAIDPSSPFTGGSLLGDRIRMSAACSYESVFIRSMATRGALGGLAPRTAETIFALDAAGFDYIIIETVGVGQAEVDIVRNSDTVALVLVPGMGDAVQALKAGIIEIADIFVINKADYDGADRLEREILTVLSLGDKTVRQPEIVKTVASRNEGINELSSALIAYQQWAEQSGTQRERTELFLRSAYEKHLAASLFSDLRVQADQDGSWNSSLLELYSRKHSPYNMARIMLDRHRITKTKAGESIADE